MESMIQLWLAFLAQTDPIIPQEKNKNQPQIPMGSRFLSHGKSTASLGPNQSQFTIVKPNPNLPQSRPFPICHCQGQSQFATVKVSPNLP